MKVHVDNEGKLFDSNHYNFSEALHSQDIRTTYQKSGMCDIVQSIEDQLRQKGILSSLFVEFNLLGTILDPSSKDELNSFTYIKSSTPGFDDDVIKYSNKIISWLNDTEGSTLFYNPDVFLDPISPQVLYSIIDKYDDNGRQLILKAIDSNRCHEENPSAPSNDFSNSENDIKNVVNSFKAVLNKKYDKDSNNYKALDNKSKTWAGSSKFVRKYDEILTTASDIRSNSNTEDDFRKFHTFYHWCIPNKGETVYMAIPILGSPSNNRHTRTGLDHIQGQGVVFVFFDISKEYAGNEEEDIGYISKFLFNRIGDIVRTLTYNYLFNVGISLSEAVKKESEAVKKESIKSAVSAIMSRNMSHNLGSHYMYYTKIHLEDMAREAKSFGPDIRGAAKVLGYIQGRMDYLATLISTEKYPYAPVNFKSQLLDDLTIDSSSKRHYNSSKKDDRTTNFLLANLILSENFTRPDIKDDYEKSPVDLLRLQVKYKADDDSAYRTFTGTNNTFLGDQPTIKSESGIKNALAHLNIAMPGGTMSCHAFYNIVENFIRNSAKYCRDNFKTEKYHIKDPNTGHFEEKSRRNLNITIGIKKHPDGRFVDFIIYDNKENAASYCGFSPDNTEQNSLLGILNKKLKGIKILNANNTINKENKGLKEMLFSAAWMRAYTFGKNKNYADIITDIQSMPDGEEKLKKISEHCFSFVAVRDNGDKIDVLEEKEIENTEERLNLGILFRMPVFLSALKIDNPENSEKVINDSLSLYADVVVTNKITTQLSKIYTRLYCGEYPDLPADKRDLTVLRSVLKRRFPDIDDYRLVFGTNSDKESAPDDHIIKFKHHMSSLESDRLNDNRIYAYADTVSGGDFTQTLNELFDLGNPAKSNNELNYSYKSPDDEYLALKIKESALTRITIIDERLSRSAQNRGELYSLELTLKNLRVLNYKEPEHIESILDLFSGNEFKDGTPQTHFLSIHLGIIEKILKSEQFNLYVSSKPGSSKLGSSKLGSSDTPNNEKAKNLMTYLEEAFGNQENKPYITVHSGRGNFSEELEGPLDSYPFISLSSIESAYNNCKYLLAQLFYSTRYVGKGVYNKQS